jgi:hypothetical protein
MLEMVRSNCEAGSGNHRGEISFRGCGSDDGFVALGFLLRSRVSRLEEHPLFSERNFAIDEINV